MPPLPKHPAPIHAFHLPADMSGVSRGQLVCCWRLCRKLCRRDSMANPGHSSNTEVTKPLAKGPTAVKRTLGISTIMIGALGATLAFGTPALAASPVRPSSAVVPAAFPMFNIPFDAHGTGCEGLATITEGHDSNGAYVVAVLDSDPCSIDVAALICAPDNSCKPGNVINAPGETSRTGYIAASSANHHGIAWWTGSAWQANLHD
jgi:hypothetical protein